VQIYVKNILDKTYGNGGFSTIALGFASQTLGDPRVFGLGVHVPFGGEYSKFRWERETFAL